MREMFVSRVGFAVGGHPVVLLGEETSDKALPIFIGRMEAAAINLALTKTKPPRPLTHDLVLAVIEQLGCKVVSLQISQISKNTYFASLCVEAENGELKSIDCRPSDGIAIALKADARILVDPQIAEAAMITIEPDIEEDDDKVDDEDFKQFLGSLKASDFKLPDDQKEDSGDQEEKSD